MIVDGILVGIGLALGVLLIAAPIVVITVTARLLAHTRPAWWLHTRRAIRRARPTSDGR